MTFINYKLLIKNIIMFQSYILHIFSKYAFYQISK